MVEPVTVAEVIQQRLHRVFVRGFGRVVGNRRDLLADQDVAVIFKMVTYPQVVVVVIVVLVVTWGVLLNLLLNLLAGGRRAAAGIIRHAGGATKVVAALGAGVAFRGVTARFGVPAVVVTPAVVVPGVVVPASVVLLRGRGVRVRVAVVVFALPAAEQQEE